MCENEKIRISVDETTDSAGRKLGNVVIVVLTNDEIVSELSFLKVCKEISAENHITVARLFNEIMDSLWPKGIKYDNALLFITDAVSYMKKVAEALYVSYLKLIHITCIVRDLFRVCETIRSLYHNVDRLESNGKKVFIKFPTRIDVLKNKNPNLPLLPSPIVAR